LSHKASHNATTPRNLYCLARTRLKEGDVTGNFIDRWCRFVRDDVKRNRAVTRPCPKREGLAWVSQTVIFIASCLGIEYLRLGGSARFYFEHRIGVRGEMMDRSDGRRCWDRLRGRSSAIDSVSATCHRMWIWAACYLFSSKPQSSRKCQQRFKVGGQALPSCWHSQGSGRTLMRLELRTMTTRFLNAKH